MSHRLDEVLIRFVGSLVARSRLALLAAATLAEDQNQPIEITIPADVVAAHGRGPAREAAPVSVTAPE